MKKSKAVESVNSILSEDILKIIEKHKVSKTNDADKIAEEILSALNSEDKKTKKESKKPEDKKAKKESKEEDKKTKKPEDKNDWIKKDAKLSDKIIAITSPTWYIKVSLMGEEHNYELTHKLTKKNNIKVRLRNDINDFLIKISKLDKDIEFEVQKVINNKGVETFEDYDEEYIEEYGHKLPIRIIMMPVIEFYYHDLIENLCTDGNTKIQGNNITIDANIRKNGYVIEPKDLSVEELESFNKEKDNMIGCSIEYFRRSLLLEKISSSSKKTEDKKDENTKIVKNEDKESAADKIIAILEEIDQELKFKILSSKTKVEDRANIIRKEMLKDNKVYDKIAVILTDKNLKIEQLALLGITKDNLAEILSPETPREKIIEALKVNKKYLMDTLKKSTNIGERSVWFVRELVNLVNVNVVDVRTFITTSNEWHYFIFKEKNVNDDLRTLLINHMLKHGF